MPDEKQPKPISFPKPAAPKPKPETLGISFSFPAPGGSQPKKKGPRRIGDHQGRRES